MNIETEHFGTFTVTADVTITKTANGGPFSWAARVRGGCWATAPGHCSIGVSDYTHQAGGDCASAQEAEFRAVAALRELAAGLRLAVARAEARYASQCADAAAAAEATERLSQL